MSTHHLHSLRHGIVYGQAARQHGTRRLSACGIKRLCRKHPNHVLATAHAAVTIAHAAGAIYLTTLGMPIGIVMAINYLVSWAFGTPMHSLTIYLARIQSSDTD